LDVRPILPSFLIPFICGRCPKTYLDIAKTVNSKLRIGGRLLTTKPKTVPRTVSRALFTTSLWRVNSVTAATTNPNAIQSIEYQYLRLGSPVAISVKSRVSGHISAWYRASETRYEDVCKTEYTVNHSCIELLHGPPSREKRGAGNHDVLVADRRRRD
jgi:phosphoribosylformimino-5-aminoimidazole carboxamide ribonucleotide (ProFAR) isomerase